MPPLESRPAFTSDWVDAATLTSSAARRVVCRRTYRLIASGWHALGLHHDDGLCSAWGGGRHVRTSLDDENVSGASLLCDFVHVSSLAFTY